MKVLTFKFHHILDMQSRLRVEKEKELRDQKDRYERQIEELKRQAVSDRDFLQKEM